MRVTTMRVLCAAALALAAPAVFCGPNRLTAASPDGGHVYLLVADHASPSVIYADVSWGGIFKTVNAGEQWAPTDPTLPSGISALLVRPGTPETLYAAAGAKVFVSRDQGAQWRPAGVIDAAVTYIAAFAYDNVATIVYAATDRGVYLSGDDGKTWQPEPTGKTRDASPYIAVGNDGTVYAVIQALTATILVRSTNHGTTWQTLTAAPAVPGQVVADQNSGQIILQATNGVYSSADRGNSWTFFTGTGLPGSVYALTPDGHGHVLGISGGTVVSHSVTGDGSWTSVTGRVPAGYLYALAVTNSDAPQIYVGTDKGVFVASGDQWLDRKHGLPAMVTGVAVTDSDPPVVYATSDAGLFTTRDKGRTWTQKLAGGFGQVERTADSSVAYASASNAIYKTSDAGETWQVIKPAVAAYGLAAAASGQTLYAALENRLLKTTDGGATFSGANAGLTFGFFTGYYGGFGYYYFEPLKVDPTDSQTVYFSENVHLFKTTDGGDNWSKTAGPGANGLAIDPNHPSTIYAATTAGVSKSTDGGTTWSSAGLQDKSIADVAASRTAIYAGSSDGHLYRSDDGGATWTALDDGRGGLAIARISVTSSDDLLFAATLTGSYEFEAPVSTTVPLSSVDSATISKLLAGTNPAPAAGFVVPVAGSTTGVAGALYRSTAVLTNNRSSAQETIIVWLPQAFSGSASTYRVTLPASDSLAIDDVDGRLGISGIGSIAVFGVHANTNALDADASIDGSVRINIQAKGGIAPRSETITGVHPPFSQDSAVVTGLRFDSKARTNVGIVNLSSSDQQFEITVIGERASHQFSIVVPPLSLAQNRLPDDDYGALSFGVEAAGGGPWLVYGSTIVNGTGDVTTVVARAP